MYSLVRVKQTILLFTLGLSLGCFLVRLLPNALGVLPPPDGGYPGFTTAEGTNALKNLTTGSGNTAVGWYSLFRDSTASFNIGLGAGTLLFNNADSNTAVGTAALLFNTTGRGNTAVGASALLDNDAGEFNTAVGFQALMQNNDSFSNAFGVEALVSSTAGAVNNAFGSTALFSTVDGSHNCGFGDRALFSNVSGSNNTAIGDRALENTTGTSNIALGFHAGANQTTGSNNIYIGVNVIGVAGEGDVIRIGNFNASHTFIAGIRGVGVANAAPVIISPDGQLGTAASSVRFKKNIADMTKASESILFLRPVTFQYKSDIKGTPQFGLIAEEVAKANPDLVIPDRDGQPYTVRYEAVNAMLLNEFLKEHKKIEQLKTNTAKQEVTISELKKDIAALTTQVKEQTARIDRIRAHIEMDQTVTEVATNDGNAAPLPQK